MADSYRNKVCKLGTPLCPGGLNCHCNPPRRIIKDMNHRKFRRGEAKDIERSINEDSPE